MTGVRTFSFLSFGIRPPWLDYVSGDVPRTKQFVLDLEFEAQFVICLVEGVYIP